jgi:DNA helicase-2/ATP-dependent DNA helicase PcrA
VVTHLYGPSLVIGGAGTGKITVLALRVAYLLKGVNVDPASVLVLCFSYASSRRIRRRLTELVGHQAVSAIWARRVHSLCVKILRTDGRAVGVEEDFVIYDEEDQTGG